MSTRQTKSQKAGWAILLVVGALLVLNGVTWFRTGPQVTLEYPLEVEQVPVAEFAREHPKLVEHIGFNAREVAIWYAAFGTMSVIVAVEGLRRGTRWAWIAASIVPLVLILAGVSYGIWLELGFANVGRVVIGLAALVGLLLARPRGRQQTAAEHPAASPQPDPSSMMG